MHSVRYAQKKEQGSETKDLYEKNFVDFFYRRYLILLPNDMFSLVLYNPTLVSVHEHVVFCNCHKYSCSPLIAYTLPNAHMHEAPPA